MKLILKRSLSVFVLFIFSLSCFSQKEKKVSLGVSLDYGFGKDYNNDALTLLLNYNLLEKFRVSPSFSYFLNKDDMKMKTFSFNFHYLFPKFLANTFPAMKNQDMSFYPIVGFLISNFSHVQGECHSCSVNNSTSDVKYLYNFGFNFGVGVEYDLPTLLPLLRDMGVNFEMYYQTTDNYSRPLISFGLLYNF